MILFLLMFLIVGANGCKGLEDRGYTSHQQLQELMDRIKIFGEASANDGVPPPLLLFHEGDVNRLLAFQSF